MTASQQDESPSSTELNEMTPDDFRTQGHRLIDWIANYMERVETLPVLSQVEPGQIENMLPDSPPMQGETWDAIFGDIDRIITPGLTHWQSPNFFGYFPANSSPPAILGDLLSSGLGVQGMLWSASPACTEVETRVLDWLADMIALPEKFTSRSSTGGGVIQSTASEATLVAMLAARRRATPSSGRLIVYCSNQAHSSVVKAAMIAGVGRDHIRLIDVDDTLAMRPDALKSAIETDFAAGLTPFFICATVGTTSSGAFDPLEPIGDISREHNLWLHVDAAYAGSACVCPEHQHILAGVANADSFDFNPHKWLLTTFDCSAFWIADRAALIDALSIKPEYLKNAPSESGQVVDYRDWQIPLGRRFRALKLWFVIRHYGVEGLRQHIRRSIALAQQVEAWIQNDDRFELAAPRSLGLLCFRLTGPDARSRTLLDLINASGKAYLTHTTLPDSQSSTGQRFVLRMAIGGVWTRADHVRAAWDQIQRLADEAISTTG